MRSLAVVSLKIKLKGRLKAFIAACFLMVSESGLMKETHYQQGKTDNPIPSPTLMRNVSVVEHGTYVLR